MNRIILIGNGFDLAHGLKTSYKDFINNYWKEFIENAKECNQESYKDIYATIESRIGLLSEVISEASDYSSLLSIIKEINGQITSPLRIKLRIYNEFFENISQHTNNFNWVDIENEYYLYLTLKNHKYINITQLNDGLYQIEKLLEKHLTKIEKETKIDLAIISTIKEKIFSTIKLNEIPERHESSFIESIISEAKIIKDDHPDNIPSRVKHFIDKLYNDKIISSFEIALNKISKEKTNYVKREIQSQSIPPYFMIPKETLFLNFNYTNTLKHYEDELFFREIIHIHGKLNDPSNPMIFGYGDELAEEYKQIENKNDNEYLKNVKSIRYLETDNYRRLLSFIESEPYQIFIMGHSCGNSDRTLLNTLFEHKNCVSIKPFYHKKKDGNDNYSDIVRNISRNFTSKALMRERVVNKTYCEPLL